MLAFLLGFLVLSGYLGLLEVIVFQQPLLAAGVQGGVIKLGKDLNKILSVGVDGLVGVKKQTDKLRVGKFDNGISGQVAGFDGGIG